MPRTHGSSASLQSEELDHPCWHGQMLAVAVVAAGHEHGADQQVAAETVGYREDLGPEHVGQVVEWQVVELAFLVAPNGDVPPVARHAFDPAADGVADVLVGVGLDQRGRAVGVDADAVPHLSPLVMTRPYCASRT